MSIVERKERQRAERYELILATARELAEAEGWDAVTTRRLAGLIDYSQPVLYSHFKGKAEIMAAVATKGFEELAARLEAETENVTGDTDVLRNVCAAYLDFARSRPVVYEAMFVLPTKIKFASEETPPALRAAFAALVNALGSDRQDSTFLAEVLWGALHGMVLLMQSERIPAIGAQDRLDILVQKFGGDALPAKVDLARS
ncbi:MAG: TetR/AcrR family transcriptional regulator [Caulobacteraceae bacterium]|nr:TetR/AcrR family transcriptional regulator [Caulobacteraceae bacterium]